MPVTCTHVCSSRRPNDTKICCTQVCYVLYCQNWQKREGKQTLQLEKNVNAPKKGEERDMGFQVGYWVMYMS